MRTHRLLAPALAYLLAWTSLSGCTQGLPASPAVAAPVVAASAPEAGSSRLAAEMRTLIGPAACDADAQCRTLAVGAKACGGPGAYWAWSSAGTDEARLRDLAQRQAQGAGAENTRSGMVSNCSVVADPGARCDAGRCVLRQAGEAAPVR